jgi:hypothetical protein
MKLVAVQLSLSTALPNRYNRGYKPHSMLHGRRVTRGSFFNGGNTDSWLQSSDLWLQLYVFEVYLYRFLMACKGKVLNVILRFIIYDDPPVPHFL